MFRATLALLLLFAAPAVAGLEAHIDPFIGTGAHGHTFPGPTLPFGMVQLSPDTRLTGWDGCSGYHFSDTVVYGFSHTHLSGTGVSDYGDVLLMPMTGEPLLTNGYPDDPDNGYGSRFSKENETAAAGSYRTVLDDYGVEVELTATPRTGLHRYVFPEGRPAHVIVDLLHRDRLLDVGLSVVNDTTIEGFRRSSAWARDQLVHFVAVFSEPFAVTSLDSAQAVLSYGEGGGEVLAQVAISPVDADGARRNLEAEFAEFEFELIRWRAEKAWASALAPYVIEGACSDDLTVMATAIYHSYIAPNLFSDVDGRYRGMDRAVHTAKDRDQYTVFSLWDTYRATHPLFTLMQRERTRDFTLTALSHYAEGGRLPVWELAGNETDCMIGYHGVSFLADAALKGITFDLAQRLSFLDALIDSADRDHFGLEAYKRLGYIPSDAESESVSKTLEYSYDDACIARVAKVMRRDDDARRFARRAQAWRHLFDPASRCFRPRANGRWLTPYDPRRVDFHHTEANGWQYRFGAPHHMPQHVELLGGDAATSAVLDSLFTIDSRTTGRTQSDITGLMGQYAHGNEPSHHMAWLYHFTGEPQKSADRVARILDAFYTPEPDGLIGNEDCGQMSSWYVLSAYGLYDVAPTSLQWLIAPPRHERMTLWLGEKTAFETCRFGTGAVQHVTWNGKNLERSWLSHAEVAGGGELVFHLGDGASDWGRDPKHRPGTEPLADPIPVAPWAVADADRFQGSMTVALATAEPNAELFWTDAAAGDPDRPYTGPMDLTETTILRFLSVVDGERSPVTTARFDIVPDDRHVELHATPNPQYDAGGPDALIDARRGPADWRTGLWHGYQGEDFSATVRLDEALPLTRAGAGFLQDTRSWIVFPAELLVEVSSDGTVFRHAGRAGHDVPVETEGVVIRDFLVELDGLPIRALRFTARQFGHLPDWHPGAGGETFIFLDELILE